jgi:hypothetical protein
MRAVRGIAALVLGLVTFGGSSVASGAKPSNGCGPGFDLGPVSFEEYLELPRTQAAIEDGLVDEAGVEAFLTGLDRNGNGVVCVQLPHGYEVGQLPGGAYFYNLADDNAAVP